MTLFSLILIGPLSGAHRLKPASLRRFAVRGQSFRDRLRFTAASSISILQAFAWAGIVRSVCIPVTQTLRSILGVALGHSSHSSHVLGAQDLDGSRILLRSDTILSLGRIAGCHAAFATRSVTFVRTARPAARPCSLREKEVLL
jgi:hypothetical protein